MRASVIALLPLLFVSLAATAADFADADFNGRWDIVVHKTPPDKAWWLEVSGAGTAAPKGRFVGFPGGDTNDIEQLSISDHVLHWTWRGKKGAPDLQYEAKYVNGNLEGQMTPATGEPIAFTAYRAPVIRDRDDGTWRRDEPVKLFNGANLDGWTSLEPGATLGWTVENGVLKSTGHAANLITNGRYWNFILHAEYNVAKGSNSGIGLRGRYEVQIQDDYGKPVESHINGALYSRIKPLVNASRPADQWQTIDIRLVGRDVSVTLNGKAIIVRQPIEGLTAIAFSPFEAEPGAIELQGDHGPVEFRNLVLTPLYKSQNR
jgi:hypothetical protein